MKNLIFMLLLAGSIGGECMRKMRKRRTSSPPILPCSKN